MRSRYVVIAGIAVVALVLSAGLAWGGGGNRMHRDMPSDIQNMSTEQMQDLCQELHEQMGSMMDGSGMDSMMDGSGMDSMMDGSGMDSMMDGSGMDSMMDGSGMDSMMDGSGMDSMMDGSGMDGARK